MNTMYSVVVNSDLTNLNCGHGTLEMAQREAAFLRANTPAFCSVEIYMVMSAELAHVADMFYIGARLVPGDVYSTKIGVAYNSIKVL